MFMRERGVPIKALMAPSKVEKESKNVSREVPRRAADYIPSRSRHDRLAMISHTGPIFILFSCVCVHPRQVLLWAVLIASLSPEKN